MFEKEKLKCFNAIENDMPFLKSFTDVPLILLLEGWEHICQTMPNKQ